MARLTISSDVVQPVPQHGDGAAHRQQQERDLQRHCGRPGRFAAIDALRDDQPRQTGRDEGGRGSDPAQLLPGLAAGPPEPQHHGDDRCHQAHGDDQDADGDEDGHQVAAAAGVGPAAPWSSGRSRRRPRTCTKPTTGATTAQRQRRRQHVAVRRQQEHDGQAGERQRAAEQRGHLATQGAGPVAAGAALLDGPDAVRLGEHGDGRRQADDGEQPADGVPRIARHDQAPITELPSAAIGTNGHAVHARWTPPRATAGREATTRVSPTAQTDADARQQPTPPARALSPPRRLPARGVGTRAADRGAAAVGGLPSEAAADGVERGRACWPARARPRRPRRSKPAPSSVTRRTPGRAGSPPGRPSIRRRRRASRRSAAPRGSRSRRPPRRRRRSGPRRRSSTVDRHRAGGAPQRAGPAPTPSSVSGRG